MAIGPKRRGGVAPTSGQRGGHPGTGRLVPRRRDPVGAPCPTDTPRRRAKGARLRKGRARVLARRPIRRFRTQRGVSETMGTPTFHVKHRLHGRGETAAPPYSNWARYQASQRIQSDEGAGEIGPDRPAAALPRRPGDPPIHAIGANNRSDPRRRWRDRARLSGGGPWPGGGRSHRRRYRAHNGSDPRRRRRDRAWLPRGGPLSRILMGHAPAIQEP